MDAVQPLTPADRRARIEMIRQLPARVRAAVAGLTPEQLTTRYLPDEWSVAQIVHHLADSHIQAYVRTKMILTAERPTLMPYSQVAWASTPDALGPDLEPSLRILDGLQARWADLLASVPDDGWSRVGVNPETGEVPLERILRTYSRHGESHVDQIRNVLAAAK